MRKLLFLIALVFSSFASAQLTFSAVKHDFGDLNAYAARHVDILLHNTGTKQEWILTIKKPTEVAYITSKQLIEKDSTIALRLHVNPGVKGRFQYDVQVFTSDRAEATIIHLSGNLKELDQNSMAGLTDCPDFSSQASGRNPNSFDLTVVTIDKDTRKELSNSTVTLIQNGQAIWQHLTNKNGLVKKEATLGLSYFYASHEGYFPAELGAYINFKRNYVVLELERTAEPIEPPLALDPPVDTITVAQNDPEPAIIIDFIEHNDPPTEIDSSTIAQLPPSFTDLDRDNFDPEYFKPVNVVFVLDVSSSMKQVDKIELMKYSLFQLTDMLRPEDKITLVTYADESRVLLPATSGDNKETIRKEVEQLEAFGYTAGGKGITLGFKEAKRSKISDGTNHVIIITDGAFNRGTEDYEATVKKYAKEDIHLSVVGIKNKDVHEEDMRRAAEFGGGHYVPIFKLADAQNNLKQEIRVLSFRY